MNKKVLVNYLGADFQSVEKPRGGVESKIFLLRVVHERGWRGVNNFSKPPLGFFTAKKF